MYVYNKKTKQIYNTDILIVLNQKEVENALLLYGSDIDNLYGVLDLDEYGKVVYKPHILDVFIDNENNIHRKPLNDYTKVFIDKKEYYENLYKSRDKDLLMKYFDGEIHLFEKSDTHVYNPETNKMEIYLEYYKNMVKSKIANSEEEIRYQGFEYSLWDGQYFAQPFRDTPSDLGIFKSTKEDLPEAYRRIKLFTMSNKKRNTSIGTYKWLVGADVTDLFLTYQIRMINAYSGYVKGAIYEMVKYVETINDIDTLKYFESNHVFIILDNMKKAIDKIEELEIFRQQVILDFKSKNIKPREDKVNL